MNRLLPIACLLLIAGCNQQEAPSPPANDSVEPAKPPAEVPSLEGNWKVSRIGGVADAAAIGMTAAITKNSVTLSSGCIRRAWTYTQRRNIVAFTSSPGGSSNCGGASPGPDAETAYAALNDANMAIFSKDGREAGLSGTGGTLTLERR
jgi:hypothetical protein